jgi:Leucine-rich repeat (LRR) protein
MNDRHNLNLFYKHKSDWDKYSTAQEINDEILKIENLHIPLFAMDMPTKSLKYRKDLENKWITFFPKLINVKSLSLRLRVNQTFFEAVCKMKNLQHLHFWSSTAENISSISKLSNLNSLYFDSFSRLKQITPLKKLHNLKILSISNCFKIEDYDVIGNLTSLSGLCIQGDQMAPKHLQLKSIKSFKYLINLKHLNLSSTTVMDKSYETILEMKNLERFDTTDKMSKNLRDKIMSHPKLKAGFFVDWDWENKKIKAGKDWSS